MIIARRWRALYRLTGSTPLLPRFALGNWWSRYHPYSAAEYLDLMDRFAADDVPLSVAVLDMDWHLVDIDPKYGTGWTGYTWNRDLFPDPPGVPRASCTRRGLATSLNVHPAEGVHAHEERYAGGGAAHAASIPSRSSRSHSTRPTARSCRRTSKQLHHPLEDEGVDFWWLDWQQGGVTRIAGLDPLWLLNHFHYLDSGRDGRRPLTFSRYAGVGSHRYPVGFSGDTVISWASLDFQPYFTATASNVGYGWWSHDIGGHFFGVKDDELATRWVQLGVYSPILRLHSSLSPFNTKEPWRFGARGRADHEPGAAHATPAAALPVLDEPAGARAGRAARPAGVLRAPGSAARRTRIATSSCSARTCSSRRSRRRAIVRPASRRRPPGCRPASGSTCRTA